MRSKPQRDP